MLRLFPSKTNNVTVLPHIINACVFTSALSAGNSNLFVAARILYGLSLRGQAPRIFSRCTKKGLPWVAIVIPVKFICIRRIMISSFH